MRKRHTVFLTFALISLIIILAVIFYQNSQLHRGARVQYYFEKKIDTIRVVMDDNYPPYIFKDSQGNFNGILIDEWRLFEKKTGIHVLIVPESWGTALEDMASKKYDVIDTIFYSPERDKIYDFTDAYVQIKVPVYYNAKLSGIVNIQSLSGFAIAVKRGDQAIEELHKLGLVNLIEYESYEAIIKDAAVNKIVAFAMDAPPAQYFLYRNNLQNVFKTTDSLYEGAFHRAVASGNTDLRLQLKEGFALISKSEHQAIQQMWFGKLPGGQLERTLRIVRIVLVCGSLFFLLLLLWNWILQRQVNHRTRDLRSAMTHLKYSEDKLKAIFQAVPDLYFVVDLDGKIVDFLVNDLLPVSTSSNAPKTMIGSHYKDYFPEAVLPQFQDALIGTIDSKTPIIEYSVPQVSGQIKHFEARFIFIDHDLNLIIIRDVSERHEREVLIYNMSIRDLQTGLFNRNYFEKEITAMVQSHEDLNNMCVLICDIDGLKLVNDTFGHAEGDHYLRVVSELLKKHFNSAILIARIGGDEFALLSYDSEEIIQRNKLSLQTEVGFFTPASHPSPISISIGYAFTNTTTTVKDAFRLADDIMYREKLNHRQSIRSQNIDLLMKMLEVRDFITEGHSQRMQENAVLLAQRLGFKESDISDLKLLAQFHDIGKIGISDQILFKPGKLNDEERKEMQRHSEIGFRIAESSNDLLPISEWIFKHHEWWDGTGYPFGLSKQDIPLQCRILSIVDAYDAMTNDRPYRKALPQTFALQELAKYAGTQFDPTLVQLFVEILESQGELL